MDFMKTNGFMCLKAAYIIISGSNNATPNKLAGVSFLLNRSSVSNTQYTMNILAI